MQLSKGVEGLGKFSIFLGNPWFLREKNKIKNLQGYHAQKRKGPIKHTPPTWNPCTAVSSNRGDFEYKKSRENDPLLG